MVPFLGTLNNRCRTIIMSQKGTLILTTTPMALKGFVGFYVSWGYFAGSIGIEKL